MLNDRREPQHPLETVGLDVLEDVLSFYIRSIDLILSRDLDHRLEGLEVAKGKGKITTLLLVDSHPGIRPSVIARLILRDRSAMAKIVDQLVDHGLMTREIAAEDGRAQALYITEKGRELAGKVRAIAIEQSNDFFADVPAEEQQLLLAMLRRIYRRAVRQT